MNYCIIGRPVGRLALTFHVQLSPESSKIAPLLNLAKDDWGNFLAADVKDGLGCSVPGASLKPPDGTPCALKYIMLVLE